MEGLSLLEVICSTSIFVMYYVPVYSFPMFKLLSFSSECIGEGKRPLHHIGLDSAGKPSILTDIGAFRRGENEAIVYS